MTPSAPARSLEIRLLGEPEVLLDGVPAALPASKKCRALLGYLVRTGRSQRRERLCELLWDGPDDPRAGLRWSLAKLRPLLDLGGAIRVAADREHVAFESHGALVDVVAVSALSQSGLAAAPIAALEEAIARFRGPFLEGLDLSSCPAFHAWCVAEREALQALHVALLSELIERSSGQPARALGPARALIALDPLAESPRLLLLDLLTALGDGRRALEAYDDYARTLRRELGVEPSFELERRRMALSRLPAAPTGAAPRRGAPELAPEPRVAQPPARHGAGAGSGCGFVGRERERELLGRLLDVAGQGAAVLLVLGEPGIGKTRLLEELGRLAAARGGRALSGRAFEAELVRPYGAFIDALRGAFPEPERDAAPELAAAAARSPFSSPASDRGRLYDAVASLLAGAAGERAPLVLVLDDLQWFDEASAELLHYLARALRGSPVLFAASARKGELVDNLPAQRLVRALGREGLVTSVELGPLDQAQLKALVGAAHPNVPWQRVFAESAGNPLFALEAARALDAGSQDLVGSLARLIAERLGRLEDAERGLLSWAGALGRSFDVDVLARVTGLAVPQLLASLERLEGHAILRSRETGYDFAHDLVRQGAYRQMSSPRQRLVHAQIARALSAGPDPDGALASDVAHHAALAGDSALAARACVSAGQRCLRLFAWREARELAQRGRRFAESLSDAERVPLQVELIALHVLSDAPAELDTPLRELAARARALGLAALEARVFYLRSVLQFRAGDSQAAFQSSLSRVEAARHAGPREHGIELAGAARCCLLLERNRDVGEQFLLRAEALLGEQSEELDLAWAQGLFAHIRGDLERAADCMDRALLLARRQQERWEECECLLLLAWLDLDRGRDERVLAHVAALRDVADKLGESSYGAAAQALRALATLLRGSQDAFHAFDASLPALHDAGANRLLSIAQNRAAEFALRQDADERARSYAEHALSAAQRVDAINEIATALATLAELALREREPERARGLLAKLSPHAFSGGLSARAARAIEHVQNLLRLAY